MLKHYTPWFYWNLVGEIRFDLLDIIYDSPGFKLLLDTGKSKLFIRDHYPVMNPPNAVEDITRALEHAGTFDRILNKKYFYGKS